MPTQTRIFKFRATASRFSKGLLVIPRKHSDLFRDDKGKVNVIFDDGDKLEAKSFQPCDPKVKESRLFGVARWFSKRQVVPGDVITVTVEDEKQAVYRIALDRYVLEKQLQEARRKLYSAETMEVADAQLRTIVHVTKKKSRKIAEKELLRIARDFPTQYRRRRVPSRKASRETVPVGLRVLFEEVHQGKCQICSFTFKKSDGAPYFELHHLDPEQGHHPTNILVVCPNCHAQFEYANVSDLKFASGWLVAVTINGKRLSIRQPLAQRHAKQLQPVIHALFLTMRVARLGLMS